MLTVCHCGSCPVKLYQCTMIIMFSHVLLIPSAVTLLPKAHVNIVILLIKYIAVGLPLAEFRSKSDCTELVIAICSFSHYVYCSNRENFANVHIKCLVSKCFHFSTCVKFCHFANGQPLMLYHSINHRF